MKKDKYCQLSQIITFMFHSRNLTFESWIDLAIHFFFFFAELLICLTGHGKSRILFSRFCFSRPELDLEPVHLLLPISKYDVYSKIRTWRIVYSPLMSLAERLMFSSRFNKSSIFLACSSFLQMATNLASFRGARPRICTRAETELEGSIWITKSGTGRSNPSSATLVVTTIWNLPSRICK